MADADLRARLTAHIQGVFDADHAEAIRSWEKNCREVDRKNQARGTDGEKLLPRPQKPVLRKVTQSLVNNVLGALAGECLVSGTFEMPCMLPDGGRPPLIALRNGLLDPESRELRDHTPEWFSPTCLPFDYNPAAECPTFLQAVNRSLGDDPGRVALMQEWYGYNLIHSTGAQAFMVMVGSGANGKSTMCAALEGLLGQDNVTAVGLEDFAKDFALYPTLGKLANVVADLNEIDRVDEGVLKKIASGDKMTFNRKNLSPVQARPTVRLTFATNSIPRLTDISEGIWRRMLVLAFDVVIPAAERQAGLDKRAFWVRSGELPGMLNFALEGLARLKGRNWTFTEPKASKAAKHQHRLDSNPALAFLEDRIVYDEAADPLPATELYRAYLVVHCSWTVG